MIDCQYHGPEKAAAFLIKQEGRATFVDNNTTHAVPLLLDALAENGMTPEDVDYIIITHLHLDHAGGTGALAEACPNAVVLCHHRCPVHLLNPKRLIASATMLYGEEVMARDYGEIRPLPEKRLRVMNDGETLNWRGRMLRFHDTPGHAKHHFVIHDLQSNSIFTGDAFGMVLFDNDLPESQCVMCATAPPDFDPEAARQSGRLIVETGAERAYVTHFGCVMDMEGALRQLVSVLNIHETVLNDAVETEATGDALISWCVDALTALIAKHLTAYAPNHVDTLRVLYRKDLLLNAAGVAHAAERRRKHNSST